MRIAAVQHRCGPVTEDNLAVALAGVRDAAGQGAALVLLPELHNHRYPCQTEDASRFDEAEPIPGPTVNALGEVAAECGVVVVGSVFERRAAGLYHNTAVVLDRDGRLAGRYRKMHIPDDPGYYEKYYFTPGDLGFEPIDTSIGRLGVLVCWDQWYPEAARLMTLAGAEMLLYPSAIGWDTRDDLAEQQRQHDAWITVQRSHAIANNLPVVVSNRVGHESDPSGASPGIAFWGHSFIAGPQGELLVAGGTEPQVVTADVDPGRSELVRRVWPYLRDRRTDAYGDLMRRFRD